VTYEFKKKLYNIIKHRSMGTYYFDTVFNMPLAMTNESKIIVFIIR